MREFEPHRVAWHVFAVLIGVSAVVNPPAGLAALVTPWLLQMWVYLLLGSGMLGIVAPFWSPLMTLALERAALWVQTGTLLWIVISSVYLQGWAELFGLAAYLVWITANVWRERRIASGLTRSGERVVGGE